MLLADTFSAVVDDELTIRLLRRIDGETNSQRVALETGAALERVQFLLQALERGGVIENGAVAAASEAPLFSSGRAGKVYGHLQEAWHCKESPLLLLSSAELGLDARRFVLALTDDYLAPALSAGVRSAGTAGESVLVCKLGTSSFSLGPFVTPRGQPCWDCVEPRIRANLYWRLVLHEPPTADSRVPVSIAGLHRPFPASGFAALAAILDDPDSPLQFLKRIQDFGLHGSSERVHQVLPRPHCSVCGERQAGLEDPGIKLSGSTARFNTGTGFRTVSLEDCLNRLRPLVSPVTGVVRNVVPVDVTGGSAVHAYTAGYPTPMPGHHPDFLKHQSKDRVGGKGTTAQEAEASALCEAVERYSATYNGSAHTTIASMNDLQGDVIPPNSCMKFSETQLASYEAHESWRSLFNWVPKPYSVAEKVRWSSVESLVSGRRAFIPTALVYLGVPKPDALYFGADSNGLAAGSCIEEAILQGLLELGERDAVALWWYNRTRQPAVDLSSVADPYVVRMQEYYDSIGRDIWALDLTSDLGIPCVAALSGLRHTDLPDIIFGFGAHLDGAIALRRALAELNQILPAVLRPPSNRRKALLPDHWEALNWLETTSLDANPYLVPSDQVRARAPAVWQHNGRSNLQDDIHRCLERIKSIGDEVWVRDLTRSDIPLAVVKVIVPSLRHFWRRLGPGRLYDVPVALGRLSHAVAEADMNPASIFS